MSLSHDFVIYGFFLSKASTFDSLLCWIWVPTYHTAPYYEAIIWAKFDPNLSGPCNFFFRLAIPSQPFASWEQQLNWVVISGEWLPHADRAVRRLCRLCLHGRLHGTLPSLWQNRYGIKVDLYRSRRFKQPDHCFFQRLLIGIVFGFIVGCADMYFVIRQLLEEDGIKLKKIE